MVGVDGGLDHDADEVYLTGLMESIVDSDEEEDLAESIDVSFLKDFSFSTDVINENQLAGFYRIYNRICCLFSPR